MIGAVLFDVDGTLIDSNELHATAWRETFLHFGIELPLDKISEQIGKGGDNLVPSLVPDADADLQKKIDDTHGEIFKGQYLPKVKRFPGARELLERTRNSGRKVVLASSASRDELEKHVETLEAGELIFETTSKDDVGSSKPAPDIFSAALEKLTPIAPDEALVIGDTPYDMQAARRCGIPAIGVRSGGFSDEQLHEAGASAIYDDVAAILAGFDALLPSEPQERA